MVTFAVDVNAALAAEHFDLFVRLFDHRWLITTHYRGRLVNALNATWYVLYRVVHIAVLLTKAENSYVAGTPTAISFSTL